MRAFMSQPFEFNNQTAKCSRQVCNQLTDTPAKSTEDIIIHKIIMTHSQSCCFYHLSDLSATQSRTACAAHGPNQITFPRLPCAYKLQCWEAPESSPRSSSVNLNQISRNLTHQLQSPLKKK